jgi:peptidylprolyl isomerase
VAQIQTLAKRHFFDGLTFFRVIDDFMDQTGDPENTGKGGSDLPNLQPEFTFKRGPETPFVTANNVPGATVGFIGAMPVGSQSEDLMAMMANGKVSAWGLFCPGIAAMARAEAPDSANSQFFLMRGSYPSLTRKYTAWGRVIVGQDVVNAIKVGEPPVAPQDKMLSVRLASDMPEAVRPKVRVLDSRSAVFRARLAKAVADKGSEFSVCDVDIPAKVVGAAAKPAA